MDPGGASNNDVSGRLRSFGPGPSLVLGEGKWAGEGGREGLVVGWILLVLFGRSNKSVFDIRVLMCSREEMIT